jgi:hypothetical protein
MTKDKGTFVLLSLLLVGAVLCQGCASIISKSKYPVSISSTPSNASVTIFNKKGEAIHTATTPTTVTLKAGAGWFSGEDYTVKFTKQGYKPYEARIERGLDGWYVFGNILFGGLVGWVIVDPLTGAMWTLDDLHVSLDPSTSACLPNQNQLKIVTLDQVPDNLRSRLVRIN